MFTLVWAWMLWEPDPLEHGCSYGLRVDSPVILISKSSPTWTLPCIGHGCSCNRMRANMNVTHVLGMGSAC